MGGAFKRVETVKFFKCTIYESHIPENQTFWAQKICVAKNWFGRKLLLSTLVAFLGNGKWWNEQTLDNPCNKFSRTVENSAKKNNTICILVTFSSEAQILKETNDKIERTNLDHAHFSLKHRPLMVLGMPFWVESSRKYT